MFRRAFGVCAVMSLTAFLGCGLVQSRQAESQAHSPGAISRNFDHPLVRVLYNAPEAAGDDIHFASHGFDFDLNIESASDVNGTPFDPTKETTIDVGDLPVKSHKLAGKTKDGRSLTVCFLARDGRKHTEVTVLVGKQGDPAISHAFLDRLANCLAHETPEEIAKRKVQVRVENVPVSQPVKSPTSPSALDHPADPQ